MKENNFNNEEQFKIASFIIFFCTYSSLVHKPDQYYINKTKKTIDFSLKHFPFIWNTIESI